MTTETRTADVLSQAADLIETNGWFGYEDGDQADSLCAGLAIIDADADSDSPVLATFADFLGLEGAAPFDAIVDWNDVPERTADEVVAALRAAAEANR